MGLANSTANPFVGASPVYAPHQLGKKAETLAKRFLKAKGYRILETNVRIPSMGEIDIVAMDQDEVVFVEVKALSASDHFDPSSHVTAAKKKRLIRLAQAYTSDWKEDMSQRIDIVLVYGDTNPWTVDHLPNAIEVSS